MKKLSIIGLLLGALTAGAMDRFAALAMVESGNNDLAVGKDGEVSRYQITPTEWNANTSNVLVFPLGHPDQLRRQSPTNAADALEVAMLIQFHRQDAFEKSHHRAPTDAEWYLLWHRPARVLHPKPAEAARARRFANLCTQP